MNDRPSPGHPARLPMERIVAFLDDQPGQTAETVLQLRALVLKAAPEATETLLWRGLSYHCAEAGGRVRGAVCQISIHEGGVRLSFIHGVRLPDPGALLRGGAKSKRFVALSSPAEIESLPLAELVRSAVALAGTMAKEGLGI
jgi:hypothetical protein